MFEYLKDYRVVIVSGPHRSGTTIATKCIAHDTGMRFLPEESFGHDNVDGWKALVKSTTGGVIHCPSMCYRLPNFGQDDDIATVMVYRAMEAILASQHKIGWKIDGFYQDRYKAELGRYGRNTGNLARVKYQAWEEHQRATVLHPYEAHYVSLSAHPLWIPDAERVNFGPRQVER